MTPIAYWSGPGRYQVRIEAGAITRLLRLCAEGWPQETGGILVGRYSPKLETAVISDALPPPRDSERGPTWFVRGVESLRTNLDRLWRSRPRRYYIGEWHLHPNAAPRPSREDLDQMQAISAGPDCRVPLLLVAGGSPGSGFRFDLWVFSDGQPPIRLVEVPLPHAG